MYLAIPVLALLNILSLAKAFQQLPIQQFPITSVSSTDLVEDCGDDTYVVAIEDITLDPAFPERGKSLKVTIDAVVNEDILEGSEMHMTVKLGVVTLIRKTVDFCEELKGTSLECPVQKGPIKFVKTFDLPQELPKGDFRIYLETYNYDDNDIACLKAHVDFRRTR